MSSPIIQHPGLHGGAGAALADDRPDILVVLADSLGFSSIGPFGGARSAPPMLDPKFDEVPVRHRPRWRTSPPRLSCATATEIVALSTSSPVNMSS